MHPVLRNFIRQYFHVVVAAVVPVVVTAFLSIPFSLGGHPGELRLVEVTIGQHMT
jgi:hypothetical protein